MRQRKKVSLAESSDQHYKKVEDLPEERKRAYESLLEDFDKQGDYLQVFLNRYFFTKRSSTYKCLSVNILGSSPFISALSFVG